jgi:CubicO group peptidase (beta-lactamase class C family)
MTKTAFQSRYGFARTDVTLANWRESPFSRWTFQNVPEMVRSAVISATSAEEPELGLGALADERLPAAGGTETVTDFLKRSNTDTLVVMKKGRFVADYAAPTASLSSPHIVFSISKSLTAILAGMQIDAGLLDPAEPVVAYVPEMEGSAYADASVQQVLDMRLTLDFTEDYLDTSGAFARYRRATMWNPGGGDETLLQFIASIGKGPGDHGGAFSYRSPNSDLLGVVVERVSGQRVSDLFREKLLQPLNGHGRMSIAVDAEGTERTAGGVSITARDLARVGEMMRNGGMGPNGRILSQAFVTDTVSGGDKAAWKAGEMNQLLEHGSYRNKWYSTGFASGAFMGIGIHGQWLYVDPSREVVLVKQSSEPVPSDDLRDRQWLASLSRLAELV